MKLLLVAVCIIACASAAGLPPAEFGGVNNGQGNPGAFGPKGGVIGERLAETYGPPEWAKIIDPFRDLPQHKVFEVDDDDHQVETPHRHKGFWSAASIVMIIIWGCLMIILFLLMILFLLFFLFGNRDAKSQYRSNRDEEY